MRTRIKEFDKGPGGRPIDKGCDKGLWKARKGFTLIELLAVITIIIIIAAVAVPTLSAFRPNVSAAAERQLLGALARARQLAISQRTTVYMVFCPTNFWNDTAFGTIVSLTPPPPAGVQTEVNKAY